MNEKPPQTAPDPKGAWLIGAMLITLAVSGYFMGLQQTSSHISLSRALDTPTSDSTNHPGTFSNSVPGIVSYAQVDRKKLGPNADFTSNLRWMARPAAVASTAPPMNTVTEEQRRDALAQRETLRAFDSAPPRVPHPITQDSSAACLACHGTGLVIKDRIAAKISHPPYSNCTQCHVPNTGPRIPTPDPILLAALAGNLFTPVAAPSRGTRASPSAPPTIPHPTFMRSDCQSCHGPAGLFGLRTPHPDRQSCVQCHAPNAELDQRVFTSLSGTPR